MAGWQENVNPKKNKVGKGGDATLLGVPAVRKFVPAAFREIRLSEVNKKGM